MPMSKINSCDVNSGSIVIRRNAVPPLYSAPGAVKWLVELRSIVDSQIDLSNRLFNWRQRIIKSAVHRKLESPSQYATITEFCHVMNWLNKCK